MTDIDTLIERLRERAPATETNSDEAIMLDAAAALAELRETLRLELINSNHLQAERDRLREALEPFRRHKRVAVALGDKE